MQYACKCIDLWAIHSSLIQVVVGSNSFWGAFLFPHCLRYIYARQTRNARRTSVVRAFQSCLNCVLEVILALWKLIEKTHHWIGSLPRFRSELHLRYQFGFLTQGPEKILWILQTILAKNKCSKNAFQCLFPLLCWKQKVEKTKHDGAFEGKTS